MKTGICQGQNFDVHVRNENNRAQLSEVDGQSTVEPSGSGEYGHPFLVSRISLFLNLEGKNSIFHH